MTSSFFYGKNIFQENHPWNCINFFSYIILSNCFCVWYNLLCEEHFVSEMWYADDSFIISFSNMLFLILA